MKALGCFTVRSLLVMAAIPLSAATFGTVVAPAGGGNYSDIVLDESRSQLYLVASTQNLISVYSLSQKTFLNSFATDSQPVSAALSLDKRYLYVTAYSSAVLDVIDLGTGLVSSRVSLPSNPEGLAVGGDGKALITAVSPAAGSTANTLLVYDPNAAAGNNIQSVPIPPSPPQSPVLPPPSNRVYSSYNSRLATSPDGTLIIGANGTSATGKVVFVYEVASGTVLRSRAITNLSNTISVSRDGTKFMAGSTLFSTQTLQVMAQENAANSPFSFASGTNFNLQANQGGSVFSPDGTALYAAFNIAPSGAARASVSQLLVNDPDNLAITLGYQVPENLAGKMVIDSAGANIYGISESGFMQVPIGTATNLPIAQPDSRVVLLLKDSCGVYSSQGTAAVPLDNLGKGRFTGSITAGTVSTTITVPGLGGPGGFGGGPGGGTITVTTAQANLPTASVSNTSNAATLNFRFNQAAAANPGTTGPSDFIVTSNEAINVPGVVHVYQNNRAPEAGGTIIPVTINASAGEGLTDIVLDSIHQRLYIANAGMNRLEVFDTAQRAFLAPIKVGQLPQAMALSTDGSTLYVANTGGESISIVDLNKGAVTGSVVFPALPFNASVTISTPQTIAVGLHGPEFVMSDGSIWKVDGSQAIPRVLPSAIFGSGAKTVSGGTPALWAMSATPEGNYILLLAGTGNAYLYDASLDDFTIVRQLLSTPLTGYVGAVSAGPKGAYYAVGGMILNASLTPVAGGTNSLSASGRQTGAVAAVSSTAVAQFTVPVRASATATLTDAGQIEMLNASTGTSQQVSPTLEGPASTVTGTTRTSVFARTLAVDQAGGNAYALTASGLSVIPLQTAAISASRPSMNAITSLADYTPGVAAGGLMTIFGRNLSNTTALSSAPLPTVMGGTCVTINNQAAPITYVSPGQINAQIPVGLAAGRYPLVIRSIANNVASASSTLTVSKYAPAVLIGGGGQPAIFHADGSFVTKDNPANRDEELLIYATGLGAPLSGTVVTGQPSPASPLATTAAAAVFFGDRLWKQAAVIVDWSGLAPGLVGIYQLNVRVPGFHISGDSLPVTVEVGGTYSSTTGPVAPMIAVN
jgi:uncharacterized protein (TIGR03437 family)